jgi:succinylglutamate desuccinylase
LPNWTQEAEGVWIKEIGVGPTIGIIGGVHGNEQAGAFVVGNEQSRNLWPIDSGRVVAIIGNPEALKIGQRHTGDSPEADMNRHFRPISQNDDPRMYEVQRVQKLLPFLEMCDVTLDLHEHDTKEPAGTSTLLIGEKRSLVIAKAIGATYISYDWASAEPGSTDGHMDKIDKFGVGLETGWRGTPYYNAQIAEQAVRRLLYVTQITGQPANPLHADPTLVRLLPGEFPETDSSSFTWARRFGQMEPVKPGELIAINGEKEVVVPDIEGTIRIIFPDDFPEIGAEFHLLGVDTPDPTLGA